MKNKNTETYTYVHTGRMPLSELQCPEIVKKALKKLIEKHKNVPSTAMLNILRINLGHMILSKKIKLNFAGEIITPGQFGMIWLKSGTGKDYSCKDIENYLFKKHKDWFKEQADLLYEQMLKLYEEQQIEDKAKKNKIAEDFEIKQLQIAKKEGELQNVPTTAENPF